MSLIEHVFPPEMMEIREEQLITALSECAGAFYDFNVTKNMIIGTPIQVIDGEEYSIHDKIDLPPHCPYTDIIKFWGNNLAPEEQPAFLTFFDRRHLEKCYESGKLHVTHTYRTKDALGNTMIAEQNILLYKDVTSGDLLGLTYVKDMKPLDILVRKEKEARIQAEKASRSKTSFLFNLSHDIRTPMNAIMGFADIIDKNTGDEERVKDAIRKVKEAGDVLLKLLDDVLNVSRIESGCTSLDLAPMNLDNLWESIQSLFGTEMKNADIQFTMESHFYDKIVMADNTKLLQIFINLISNAQKFTPAGGSVTVQGEQVAPETYVFSVKDSGVGMSSGFQKRAYDEFERERNDSNTSIKGTGLGLSIVQKLVELMSGQIELRSKLGCGSEFIITLRLPKSEYIPLINTSDLSDADFTGKNVLLVEDNDLNAEIASVILQEMGFTVDTAVNGLEAVEKVKDSVPGQYDLILMDIQMPKMNGYEATREIRKLDDKGLASIPIVAMTANAFDNDRQQALINGMDEHIGKPISTDKLKKVFVKLLG